MKINKNYMMLFFISIICLVLWIMTYRFLGTIVFFTFWFVYIVKDRFKIKLLKSVIMLILFAILFMISEYNRYELTTTFNQPCWSPDGKQIAFFMIKDVTRYRPGMLGYIPTPIWRKAYLCTMDYNGKNFKQIKEIINIPVVGAVFTVKWPNINNILYNYKIIGETKYGRIDGVAAKIRQDGTGFKELWQWNEKSEYQDVYWLTPKEDYLVLAKYTDKGRVYAIYDRKENKIKKELLLTGQLYGSYKDNTIVINYNNKMSIIDLNTLAIKEINRREPETFKKPLVLDDFEYTLSSRSYSPNRKMYVNEGGVWTIDNKVVSNFYIKPKRSYLFNIFWK